MSFLTPPVEVFKFISCLMEEIEDIMNIKILIFINRMFC